jgi:uncharacterized NAD(P)/FAD-binding protein YdhS
LNLPAQKSIAIIGGGASATLLLAQLSVQLTNSSVPVNIYIIEPKAAFKVGLAYAVEHPSFILNVAAKQMGAWAQKPTDFYEWLTQYPHIWKPLHPDFTAVNYGQDDFVPRMIYGEYLRWIFDNSVAAAAEKNIKVHKISASAHRVSAEQHASLLHIELDTCESLLVDMVVVATGNSLQKQPHLCGKNIFLSPYQTEFLQQDWRTYKNIIVVGSGLSMVDTIQYLTYENYTGNIQVFSRHGLIPLPHLQPGSQQLVACGELLGVTSARNLLKKIRTYIVENDKKNIPWQSTLNSLRQDTNRIWLSLPQHEQKKLSRLLPWWNIARHRIPLVAYELINRLQREKKLTITKGEVKRAEHSDDYFLINLKHKNAMIKAEKMIICSGYCYHQQLEKLCGNLLDKETFNNSGNFKLSNHYPLYGIGPALSNFLFETTAINEIRQQSLKIATAIAESLCAENSFAENRSMSKKLPIQEAGH